MSRLLAELDPNEGISREEVALLFGHHDTEEGMRVYKIEYGDGLLVSERTNPHSGDWEYRLGDVEKLVERRRREGPRTGQSREDERKAREAKAADDDGVKPPEVRAGGQIIFSDDDTPDAILLSDDNAGGSGKGTMAIPVAKAAEQAGMSEDDLSARLVGRARLKVVNGDLVVPLADLRELAKDGAIPKPSERSEQTPKPTPDPLAVPTDAAAERRSASMGAALGIDVAGVKPANAAEPKTPQQFQTATATERPSRRLGAPRRWGQN
jgi:hypothetical protein